MIGPDPISYRQPYIDGKFCIGAGPLLGVENPATGAVFAEVETCSLQQTEDAILAARRSFDEGEWAGRSRAARVAGVLKLGKWFEDHQQELAATLTAEAGSTATMMPVAHLGLPLLHLRQVAELYQSLPDQEYAPRPVEDAIATNRVALSVLRYEPIGVVSAISAYNVPLWIAMWKVIPALLAGNSVVLRPSPLTPISALAFGAAADAAGLPPGVLNVVIEGDNAGGELMTAHRAVDCVSFTGSTAVGRAIMAQAASTTKRVLLELGGKSVQLYLPDAAERAAAGAAIVFGNNSGQACVAPTRMLVPRARKAEVLAGAASVAQGMRIGDPRDPNTSMGPLISAGQVARCERYVTAAVEAGATLVAGGHRPQGLVGELAGGHWFEPTVLDAPDNSNPAAQDEIFGPVLTVLGYDSIDEAVAIANDSVFGLSGQVFGNDLKLAVDVALRIRTGAVQVNGGTTHAYASSGGYKQSGIGRERGVDGIRSFQQTKHLSIGNPI